VTAACGDGSGGSSRDPDGAPGQDGSAAGACDGEDGKPLPVAPQGRRVDLDPPSFRDPIDSSNALFPFNSVHSALALGEVEGDPLRVETTLLPTRSEITLSDGTTVEAVESQSVTFRDGRISEVARRWYGQDDDGAVWHLGKEVYTYEEGEVADMKGAWQAGRDGAPAGMMMPADPRVNDVYRPENVCGVAFEEVTVEAVDLTGDGPTGPVEGIMAARALHSDGLYSDKLFAPGYGELSSGAEGNHLTLALAVPIDTLAGPTPAELDTLAARSAIAHDVLGFGDWSSAAMMLAEMSAAWEAFLAGGGVPPLLEAQMVTALAAADAAITNPSFIEANYQIVAAARATYDLRLRHQPQAEIDRVRFDLLLAQVLVDGLAGDDAGIRADITAAEWVWARIANTFDAVDQTAIEDKLAALRVAHDAEDWTTWANLLSELRASLGDTGWR